MEKYTELDDSKLPEDDFTYSIRDAIRRKSQFHNVRFEDTTATSRSESDEEKDPPKPNDHQHPTKNGGTSSHMMNGGMNTHSSHPSKRRGSIQHEQKAQSPDDDLIDSIPPHILHRNGMNTTNVVNTANTMNTVPIHQSQGSHHVHYQSDLNPNGLNGMNGTQHGTQHGHHHHQNGTHHGSQHGAQHGVHQHINHNPSNTTPQGAGPVVLNTQHLNPHGTGPVGPLGAVSHHNNNNTMSPLPPPQSQALQQQTWEISILGTLLFKTIQEALRKSCLDTQKEEAIVLLQMEEMNNEMKHLRDALDKYFLNDEPDVLRFQEEEEMIRGKFHGIQHKLLTISAKQNSIHEKLRILHRVERNMVDLQNDYDRRLGALRAKEEEVLKDLREQRTRRAKAIQIRAAEKSHSNWAMAKLNWTLSVARKHQEVDKRDNGNFAGDLESFLESLQEVSENQNHTVNDFEGDVLRGNCAMICDVA